jgi:hypothetical protein
LRILASMKNGTALGLVQGHQGLNEGATSGGIPGICYVCGRPAARKDARRPKPSERTKCEGCAKFVQRHGRPPTLTELDAREPTPLTPYERALEAWQAHLEANAEDDLDYHRTRVRALQASRAWALTGEPCGGCAGSAVEQRSDVRAA